MAGSWGANPEELESLSVSMTRASDRLGQMSREATSALHADIWRGSDAQRSRSQWDGTLRPQLENVVASLSQCSELLRDHAREQREASRVESGSSYGVFGETDMLSGTPGLAEGSLSPPPPESSSPAETAAWWNRLTAAQKERIIADHPEWIGNRDGVDFASRDRANRALLDDELGRAIANRDALVATRDKVLAQQPHVKGGWAGFVDLIYTGDEVLDQFIINDLNDKIKYAQERVDSNMALRSVLKKAESSHLLLFDASGLKTKAAVSIGDVDTADHVAVYTPGVSTRVETSIDGCVRDMINLRDKTESVLMQHNRSDETVATVAWLGYEAPDNPLERQDDILNFSRNTFSDQRAKIGGRDLASFYTGIDASRDSDAHVVALGHSYGSLTTSEALQKSGTHVDDVVFFGSPGLNIDDAGDLDISGSAYLMEAEDDVVADFGAFGGDASNVSGIEHLLTSATEETTESRGHSEYLRGQSTSQLNMASVVADCPEDAYYGLNIDKGDLVREALARFDPTRPILVRLP
ncbi:MAG: hypothetical protein CSA84_00830 [Actinomycetales bacterium]|nr:MAG: hypothetical protein CSA84_00830 [Actinomycetales bacterium]